MHRNDIRQANFFAYWLADHHFHQEALEVMYAVSPYARSAIGIERKKRRDSQ
jgi:hypothetical protein